MARRRSAAVQSASRSPELRRQATSPESRRRSTRGASLTPSKPTPSRPKYARRQPSEALHMTTRAASKAASSAASSIASSSRRSSLNDVRDVDTALTLNRDPPAKSTRAAAPGASPSQDAPDSSQPAEQPAPETSQAVSPAPKAKPSPTAATRGSKRKRANSYQEPENGAQTQNKATDDQIQATVHLNGDAPPPTELNTRKRQNRGRAGKGPVTLTAQASFTGPPTDGTSTPLSTASPEKDAAEPPQLSEDGQVESQGPSKPTKRMPGRRRAPNSNPSVEADMRRQLLLKTRYRAVVKVLKPVLAELSNRSIDDLKNSSTAHEEVEQFEKVMAGLNARFEQNMRVINRRRELTEDLRETHRRAEDYIQRQQYRHAIEDAQEDNLLICMYQVMTLGREDSARDPDASDDETGLVPPRRGMQFPSRPTGFLDPRSDSRSRFFIETQKLADKLEVRQKLKQMQKKFQENNPEDFEEDFVNDLSDFAVYDADQRAYAVARARTLQLAEAADVVEHAPPGAFVTDPADLALRTLAEAASQREFAASASPKVDVKTRAPPKSTTTPVATSQTPQPFSPPEPSSTARSAAMSIDSEVGDHLPGPTNSSSVPVTAREGSHTEPDAIKTHSNRITDLLNNCNEDETEGRSSLAVTKRSSCALQPPFKPTSTGQPPSIEGQDHSSTPRFSEPPLASTAEPSSTGLERMQPEKNATPASPRPTQEQESQVRTSHSLPAKPKTFWDTISSNSGPARRRDPSPDRTPLARIRQILNPAGSGRKSSETTSPASTADRRSEKREMGPPSTHTSVTADLPTSRKSSEAGSITSQSGTMSQGIRSPPAHLPKRPSRDAGMESGQNRWRAAIGPQHIHKRPFEPAQPSPTPPPPTYGQPYDWSMRDNSPYGPLPGTGPYQHPPYGYQQPYVGPYDTRGPPPAGYGPPRPPDQSNYGPPVNPYLAAVPQSPLHAPRRATPAEGPPVYGPFPPGPPPYQSVYSAPAAPPPQSPSPYQQPPAGYQPPPPPPQYSQYGGQPILPATQPSQPGAQYPQQYPPAFSQQQQYGGGDRRPTQTMEPQRWARGRKPRKEYGTEFRHFTGPKRQ